MYAYMSEHICYYVLYMAIYVSYIYVSYMFVPYGFVPSIRRDDLCRKLFVNIMSDKQHCLHKLLPPQRRDLSESSVVTRLQQRNILILPKFKTNRFRHSFIMYCLDHFM